ncbi:hypothetical protein PIB30_107985, partial [Stylosanthes scabra]|nr:hypothetical protein [Stylosanthes scabra]
MQGRWLCPACSRIINDVSGIRGKDVGYVPLAPGTCGPTVSYRTRMGWPYNRPNELIGRRTDMHHMHLFDIGCDCLCDSNR